MALHEFCKAAGYSSESKFLKDFPTQESFFSKYPQYAPKDLQQNQTLPPNRDSPQSLQYTNVSNGDTGRPNTMPSRQVGGVAGEDERSLGLKKNVFKNGGKVKLKKAQWGQEAPVGTTTIPTEVTKGFNDSKSDANLANDPQAFGAMVPNQNIPGVTTPTASQDPQVQNAPLSPTNNQVTTTSQKYKYTYNPEAMNRLIGVGDIVSKDIQDRQNLRYQEGQARLNGITHSSGLNQQGGHGDYTQFGEYRPDQHTPNQPGIFYPAMAKNGGTWNGDMSTFFQEGGQPSLSVGSVIDVSPEQAQQLIKAGYRISKI